MSEGSSSIMFAQKASAIVRAAGYDPQALDIELFRKYGAEIFLSALQGIYKESLLDSSGHENMTDHQILLLKSQVTIDTLIAKTGLPILQTVSAQDIVSGHHKTLGILVSIIFSEGQRLWLEKKAKLSHQQQTLVEQVLSHETAASPERPKSAHSKLGCSKKESPVREVRPTMKMLVMEGLLDRIKDLECEIDGINNQNKQTLNLVKEFDEFVRQKPDTKPLQLSKDFCVVNGSDEAITENTLRPRANRPKSAPSKRSKAREQNQLFQRLYKEGQEAREALLRREEEHMKDLFAPSKHISMKTIAESDFTYDQVSGRRLLRTEAEKLDEERKRAKEAQGTVLLDLMTLRHNLNLPAGCNNAGDDNNRKHTNRVVLNERFEKSMEAYVLKAKQEREIMEYGLRHIPQEYVTAKCLEVYNCLEPLDLLISVEHCHSCDLHSITTRHNPDEYVAIAHQTLRQLAEIIHSSNLCVRLGVMRFIAEIDHSHCQGEHGKHESDSRIGALEVQIGYRNRNGQVLFDLLHSKLATTRWPSKSVIEKRLSAFVAKARIPTFANIVGDSQYAGFASNGNASGLNEGGAGGSDGLVRGQMLEYPVGVGPWTATPLCSPSWTLAVTDSMRSAAAPITRLGEGDHNARPQSTSHSRLAHRKPVSKSPPKKQLQRAVNKNGSNQGHVPIMSATAHSARSDSPSHPINSLLSCVQWVYDSRGSVVPLPIPVGTAVVVSNVEGFYHDKESFHRLLGSVEVIYLFGVVKGPVQSKTVSPSEDFLVRLKYFKDDTIVNIANCKKVSEFERNSQCSVYDSSTVPAELQCLLLLWQHFEQQQRLQLASAAQRREGSYSSSSGTNSSEEKVAISRSAPYWRAIESRDVVDEETNTIQLCRSSLFHQVRQMVAWVLLCLSERDPSQYDALSHTIPHPLSDDRVRLQNCYSEEMLDWIEYRCTLDVDAADKIVDVSMLVHIILQSIQGCIVSERVLKNVIQEMNLSKKYALCPSAATPIYRKITKAEQAILAISDSLFLLRNRVGAVCVELCKMRRVPIFDNQQWNQFGYSRGLNIDVASADSICADYSSTARAIDKSLCLLLQLVDASFGGLAAVDVSVLSFPLCCFHLDQLLSLLDIGNQPHIAVVNSDYFDGFNRKFAVKGIVRKIWRSLSISLSNVVPVSRLRKLLLCLNEHEVVLPGIEGQPISQSDYAYWIPPAQTAELCIIWEKFTEHFKTNDTLQSLSNASKSSKLNHSKSLESLSSEEATKGPTTSSVTTVTTNALSLAPLRSPRASQTAMNVSPRASLLANKQAATVLLASTIASIREHTASPVTGELLSYCRTMLLKADSYMTDADYLKLCDSFEMDKLLQTDEMQLFVEVFWRSSMSSGTANQAVSSANIHSSSAISVASSSGTSVPNNRKALKSAKAAKSGAEIEAIVTDKQLDKFKFLLWVLDLEPALVLANFVSILSLEFGGNRLVAVRSFSEIVSQYFSCSKVGSAFGAVSTESEFITFLSSKLGIKVDELSLFAIGLKTLFRKLSGLVLGVKQQNMLVEVVRANAGSELISIDFLLEFVTIVAEFGNEDVSLLSAQQQEPASSNRVGLFSNAPSRINSTENSQSSHVLAFSASLSEQTTGTIISQASIVSPALINSSVCDERANSNSLRNASNNQEIGPDLKTAAMEQLVSPSSDQDLHEHHITKSLSGDRSPVSSTKIPGYTLKPLGIIRLPAWKIMHSTINPRDSKNEFDGTRHASVSPRHATSFPSFAIKGSPESSPSAVESPSSKQKQAVSQPLDPHFKSVIDSIFDDNS